METATDKTESKIDKIHYDDSWIHSSVFFYIYKKVICQIKNQIISLGCKYELIEKIHSKVPIRMNGFIFSFFYSSFYFICHYLFNLLWSIYLEYQIPKWDLCSCVNNLLQEKMLIVEYFGWISPSKYIGNIQ